MAETFPPISANTLFHFTNSLENLINILTNHFIPRFSLENYDCIAPPESTDEFAWGVPMVCFCDLPLSQTGFHLSVYGEYGIGLAKSWGRSNGISPVLYVYPESTVTQTFGYLLGHSTRAEGDLKLSLDKFLYEFTCFIKPYEGHFMRAGSKLTDIRFYNEREWRYVPALPDDFYPDGMPSDVFADEALRVAANGRLTELSVINFEPNDIKYLIVRDDSEIVPLIRQIESIKGKYSYDDVRLLASRVISAEQIRHDF